eukprot:Nitzschia sp. Nitz4//scaffold36_size144017//124214//125239//NITZ4_003115-RA/size144017-processed-gene-0.93-mRNA-1//-1//CDS//3329549543//624//frame0
MTFLQVAPAYEEPATKSSKINDHLLILQNFVRTPTQPRDDIVLVTHATTLQTESLSRLLQQWSGPASVAIYLNSPQCVERFVDYFLSTTTGDDAPTWGKQVRYHLVLENPSLLSSQSKLATAPPVPSNVLRNVALHSFEANYFFSLDVSVVLSPAPTYEQWRQLQRQNPTLWEQTFLQEKRLLFLPTFAPVGRGTKPTMPKTKEELLSLVQKKDWAPVAPLLMDEKHQRPVNNTEQWAVLPNDGSFCEPFQSVDPDTIPWQPNLMGYRPGIHRFYENVRDATFGKYGFGAESSRAGYSYGIWKDFYGLYYESQKAESVAVHSEYQASFQEYLTNRYSRSQR